MNIFILYQFNLNLEYVILYQDDIQTLDIVTANGKDMVYRYLDGGVLLVKEFTTDPSATRLYHISSDRLGSVEKVTGGDGEPVFEASYDEWGRQNVSTNKICFIRGYTGHEMLPEFGLINMNVCTTRCWRASSARTTTCRCQCRHRDSTATPTA